MAVTTNSTIEFESKDKLNEYLKANDDAFSNVNYLISYIKNSNSWYVTIPRGSIVDSKVQANTYFDASYGISFLDQDIWHPGTTINNSSLQKYISVIPDKDKLINWNDDSIKNLSQLKLSYIINAIFSSKSDETQFTAYTDNFVQMWKDNHSSYMITHIEAWGVQPTKEK